MQIDRGPRLPLSPNNAKTSCNFRKNYSFFSLNLAKCFAMYVSRKRQENIDADWYLGDLDYLCHLTTPNHFAIFEKFTRFFFKETCKIFLWSSWVTKLGNIDFIGIRVAICKWYFVTYQNCSDQEFIREG